jgi:hypothetical protein
MIHREDRTEDEDRMVEGISQLVCDGYGNDGEALCRKLKPVLCNLIFHYQYF